jgi:hypothetical protein
VAEVAQKKVAAMGKFVPVNEGIRFSALNFEAPVDSSVPHHV